MGGGSSKPDEKQEPQTSRAPPSPEQEKPKEEPTPASAPPTARKESARTDGSRVDRDEMRRLVSDDPAHKPTPPAGPNHNPRGRQPDSDGEAMRRRQSRRTDVAEERDVLSDPPQRQGSSLRGGRDPGQGPTRGDTLGSESPPRLQRRESVRAPSATRQSTNDDYDHHAAPTLTARSSSSLRRSPSAHRLRDGTRLSRAGSNLRAPSAQRRDDDRTVQRTGSTLRSRSGSRAPGQDDEDLLNATNRSLGGTMNDTMRRVGSTLRSRSRNDVADTKRKADAAAALTAGLFSGRSRSASRAQSTDRGGSARRDRDRDLNASRSGRDSDKLDTTARAAKERQDQRDQDRFDRKLDRVQSTNRLGADDGTLRRTGSTRQDSRNTTPLKRADSTMRDGTLRRGDSMIKRTDSTLRTTLRASRAGSATRTRSQIRGDEPRPSAEVELQNDYIEDVPSIFGADTRAEAVDRTADIRSHIDRIDALRKKIATRLDSASTERDLRAVDELEETLVQAKQRFTEDLAQMGSRLAVSPTARERLVDMVEALLKEPEKHNIALLHAVCARLGGTCDFGEPAVNRHWLRHAISSNRPHYFATLMGVHGVPQRVVSVSKERELLGLAAKHDKGRIQLLSVFVNYAKELRLGRRRQELEAFWTDVFEAVASLKRIGDNEDISGRLPFLERLATSPEHIRLRHNRVLPDGHDVFSRACLEGDDLLLHVLVHRGLFPDPNKVNMRDETTPLATALLNRHRRCVFALLAHEHINVLQAVRGKTPLHIAKEKFPDSDVVEAIEAAERRQESAFARNGGDEGMAVDPAFEGFAPPPTQAPAVTQQSRGSLDGTYSPSPPSRPRPDREGPVVEGIKQRLSDPGPIYEGPVDIPSALVELNAAWRRAGLTNADPALDGTVVAAKQSLAQQLSSLEVLDLNLAMAKEVEEVVDRLMTEGDQAPGNIDIVRQVILKAQPAQFDFGKIALANDWLFAVAKGGFPTFLAMVMSQRQRFEEADAFQLMVTCLRSNNRLALAQTLLQQGHTLRAHRAALEPLWQDFFEVVADVAEAEPHETEEDRFALLEAILKHRDVTIDFTREGSDDQNMWTRAAQHGDVSLMIFMLNSRLVRDVAAPLQNGSTALIEAAVNNHLQAVTVLLGQRSINASYVLPGRGNVLEIAQQTPGVEEAVIAELEAALRETTAGSRRGSGSGTGLSRRGSETGSFRR